MMRILATASDMRDTIRAVLAPERRHRVAAVAFVGADADRILPSPKGLTIYCWPRAGGTNPQAVQRLIDLGASVHFVDRLHMKLFASADGGMVIGSANLTANGLDGGLRELGVWIPSGAFDVAALVKQFVVEPDFDGRLRRLHEEHILFYQRNPLPAERGRAKRSDRRATRSFTEWFGAGAARQAWRLGMYLRDDDADAPDDAVEQVERRTAAKFTDHLGVRRRKDLSEGEFTLNVRVTPRRNGDLSVDQLYWWLPKMVVKSSDLEWEKYPYVWFGEAPAPELSPPFDVEEPRFKHALREAILSLGGVGVVRSEPTVPRALFVRSIAAHYSPPPAGAISSG